MGGSGGLTPESEIVVKNVSALESVTTQSLAAIKQISVTTPKSNTIITAESITTPTLTLGGEQVLKMTKSSGSRVIVGTLANHFL